MIKVDEAIVEKVQSQIIMQSKEIESKCLNAVDRQIEIKTKIEIDKQIDVKTEILKNQIDKCESSMTNITISHNIHTHYQNL